MKIRMIALAGVAALALTAPAVASDATGWYLGLGVGWDRMGTFEQTFSGGPAPTRFKTGTSDSALIAGTFGYRFGNHVRLENEIGAQQYLMGDFSLVDADLLPRFTRLEGFGVLPDPSLPRLGKYLERMKARPSVKAIL